MEINANLENQNDFEFDIISEGFFSEGCLNEYKDSYESPNTKDATINDFLFIR